MKMEIKTKYNVGDKLYRLIGNNELKTITIKGVTVYITEENIKFQYSYTDDKFRNGSKFFMWESEIDDPYFTSIEELKKNAMLKLMDL